jgi:hypothetical protein
MNYNYSLNTDEDRVLLDMFEVAQLKLTGQLDCDKIHPKYYRRLQLLFQSSGSGEGFLSVLPQTLVFVIYSL